MVRPDTSDKVLIEGRVIKGDTKAGFADAPFIAEGNFETTFVEHAYIEPEAGWARRIGDRIEITAATQAPYMDLESVALILAIDDAAVRIATQGCEQMKARAEISGCACEAILIDDRTVVTIPEDAAARLR